MSVWYNDLRSNLKTLRHCERLEQWQNTNVDFNSTRKSVVCFRAPWEFPLINSAYKFNQKSETLSWSNLIYGRYSWCIKKVPEQSVWRIIMLTRACRVGDMCQGRATALFERNQQIDKRLGCTHSCSNATWSSYYATATNSSPCQKHSGGGVPSIIHLEIDRRVSPGTAVWIARCLALGGDSLWTLGREFVSIEIGVRVQHEKVSNGAAFKPYLLFQEGGASPLNTPDTSPSPISAGMFCVGAAIQLWFCVEKVTCCNFI